MGQFPSFRMTWYSAMPKNSKYSSPFRNRREGDREWQPTVLIVCEGETECVYFRSLIKEWRLSTVKIEEPKGSPISVVDHACTQKEVYDTCWCVIDKDQHPTFDNAKKKAKDNAHKTIISIPCFEVWIFLHFDYKTPLCNTCPDVEKLLKGKTITAVIGKYKKPELPMPDLLERMDTAIKNSKRLRNDAIASESFFTNVDELVEYLQSMSTQNRKPQ